MRIEGVLAISINKPTHHIHINFLAPKSEKIIVLVLIVVAAFTYQRLNISPIPAQYLITTPVIVLPNDPSTQFNRDGRQHCCEIISRAEAEFFTRQCPNAKMDGDRDDILCKSDSGF